MAAENEAVKPRLASAGAIRPLVQMVKDGGGPLELCVGVAMLVPRPGGLLGACSYTASAVCMLLQQPRPAPGAGPGQAVQRGEPASVARHPPEPAVCLHPLCIVKQLSTTAARRLASQKSKSSRSTPSENLPGT